MQIQSLSAAEEIVTLVLGKVREQLKVRQLIKYLPQFNRDYVSKMANAGAGTAYMPSPTLRYCYIYGQINQDQFPDSIPIDEQANFEIKLYSESTSGPILKQKDPIASANQSARYRKTGNTFRGTARAKRNRLQQSELLSKYLVVPPNENNSLYELPSNPPSKEETDLQVQLRALQKRLYFTRQAKKLQEDKQKQRIMELKNRKSPELPKTDFTYQTNGGFMRRKPFRSDSLLAQEMKHSQSFDFKPKQKKSIDQILDQPEQTRGRSQLNSRYQKASIFNNSNKRQVSHLPFIKMSDNTKIKEQNRNGEGNKTQRLSLKSFSESIQDKSFKHYTEIQRERKERELIERLQAQRLENKQEENGKNPQQPEDDGYNNLIRRRQSYMVNKYLKKLKEQTPDQPRKSLNFNRVSFPKNTAIHNYYKHDFNQQRKFYESQVISRVLDTTPKNQHSSRY